MILSDLSVQKKKLSCIEIFDQNEVNVLILYFDLMRHLFNFLSENVLLHMSVLFGQFLPFSFCSFLISKCLYFIFSSQRPLYFPPIRGIQRLIIQKSIPEKLKMIVKSFYCLYNSSTLN